MMVFVSLNKGSKRFGVQTFERAMKLAPSLRTPELEYLDMRDWYVNQLAVIAQLDEALAQAKAAADDDWIKELGVRLHTEQSKLRDYRDRVRLAGERSWAEAFFLAADHMLPEETREQISIQADAILGRTRHELKGK